MRNFWAIVTKLVMLRAVGQANNKKLNGQRLAVP